MPTIILKHDEAKEFLNDHPFFKGQNIISLMFSGNHKSITIEYTTSKRLGNNEGE